MENYTVYWYKRKTHTNPYTEGYIGITNNMERRNKEHLRNKNKTHFTNALNIYADIHYEILHTNITLEEASDLEYAYRPTTNIGWNSAIGGADVLGTLTTPVSLYHETNPDLVLHFPSITKASEELNLNIGRITQARCRGKQLYGYDGWALVLDETFDRSQTKTIGQLVSQRLSGVKKNKPSHFKGNTNRWSSEERKRIGSQHKGKTISEEQRKIVGEKNKLNPNMCRQVTLKHKDSDQTYTYHSISEASRQLNLPLSRLKSKAQRPLNKYGKDGWAIIHLGS